MTHALARAFQKSSRIVEPGAEKKPYIDVRGEGVDVAESGIADASRGIPVVQEFSDVVAAVAHEIELRSSDAPQVWSLLVEPVIDGRVVFDGALESQQSDRRIIHASYS